MGIIHGFSRALDKYMKIFTNFVYLQLLWVGFTILGFGVLGFYPSTVAMFTVVRKWVMKEMGIPIFKTFWQAYKKEFIKTNILGLVFTIVGYILYIDIQFIILNIKHIHPVFVVLIFFIVYLALSFIIFFFPIYVHFQYKFFEYFKYSFLYSLLSPFKTMGILVTTLFLLFIMVKIPALLTLFCGSMISYLWMWFVYQLVNQQEKKNRMEH